MAVLVTAIHVVKPRKRTRGCAGQAHGCPVEQNRLCPMTARTLLNRHGRACHGHPRREAAKTDPWMRGSSPRKTTFAGNLIGADSYAVHPKLNRTAVALSRASTRMAGSSPAMTMKERISEL